MESLKIDLTSIDSSIFLIREEELFGERVYLINPRSTFGGWSKDNLKFRSLLLDKDGRVISSGFPKFFNWGEQPNLTPVPQNLTSCSIVEKVDGSLLTVAFYNGNHIIRTRGSVDARILDSGSDIDFLLKKYPNILTYIGSGHSYIYEWVTPNNKIIINYGDEPDIYLIGIVRHADLRLSSQQDVDAVAAYLGVKRPRKFLPADLESLKNLQGVEGACIYSNNDQTIHKVKTPWYLALHHLKSEISSIDKLIDVWIEWDKPCYIDFYNRMASTFDYEIAEFAKGDISRICEASKELVQLLSHMAKFVANLKGLSRKDQALKIISAYGNTDRSGVLFSLLDSKPVDNKTVKKILKQILVK